ncbi:MAG: hypothetical protein WB676_15610 [Bryobacteraceae bacterium]
MRTLFTMVLTPAFVTLAVMTEAETPPQTQISNGVITAAIYLPDAQKGYYRGTRFDWSGVIGRLEYAGHNYYAPWFTKTDPTVIDFVYRGQDIVAGPCSAITGPVEEFSWGGKALGYDQAKVGGTFVKIGVGVLRKPDTEKYNPYRLYEIVDSGKWSVKKSADHIEFTQELKDPQTGYEYRYSKVVRLVENRPEMIIEHRLSNLGRRSIQTSVYDHNFLVLDHQPTGPDFTITLPFDIQSTSPLNQKMAEVQGKRLLYRKVLENRDTVAAELSGFGNAPADYRIAIENSKLRAGLKIAGDRPLSRMYLWSIRSVLAIEPYIDMSIEPGRDFSWTYDYSYYSLDGK